MRRPPVDALSTATKVMRRTGHFLCGSYWAEISRLGQFDSISEVSERSSCRLQIRDPAKSPPACRQTSLVSNYRMSHTTYKRANTMIVKVTDVSETKVEIGHPGTVHGSCSPPFWAISQILSFTSTVGAQLPLYVVHVVHAHAKTSKVSTNQSNN